MKRKRRHSVEVDDSGQDSFLDIVSNMVGILIILVVVAGLRIKQMPVELLIDQDKVTEAAIKHDSQLNELQTVQLDCLDLSRQLELMRAQFKIREAEQVELINYASSLEAKIKLHQETLDTQSQESFELQRKLTETDAKLNQLAQGTDWLKKNRPKATMVENHPTPKTQTVQEQEKEVHFRLMNGNIVHVPLTQLMERLKLEVVKRQAELLSDQAKITGSIGPIDRFSVRYTVIRRDLPPHIAYSTGQRSMIELENCEFIPESSEIGESIADALRDGSLFSQKLRVTRQNESTVTLWVYPDSFGAYQLAKEHLFRRGYLTAARPLNMGTPIAASPDGTRTSRQ